MRGPLTLDEFATLARVPAEEIERYRAAGLLDTDGDGLFDDYDALRLHVVQVELDSGKALDEIARDVREGTVDDAFFGDLLFQDTASQITIEEAAQRLGLPVETIVALGTAVGIPITRRIDPRDFEALASTKTVLDAGLPLDAILEASRVFGDAFRRVAQTEVRLMHQHVHEPMARAGVDDREITRQTHAMMQAMAPVMDPMLAFLHRQYLLRAMLQDVLDHLRHGGRSAGTIEATILFVDLSSFTALASIHGDEIAAEILEHFDGLVRALALDHAGTLVKQIGDAFMLTFVDPADAVRFAGALVGAAAREDRFPAPRIGINAGPVLYRVGDYVGTTVNLAHRLTAVAEPNEIIVTREIADGARAAGFPVEPAGVRLLRGIDEPLPLFRVARARAPERDPVCGMVVTESAARLVRGGEELVFCSEDCLRRFVETPERYAAQRASR